MNDYTLKFRLTVLDLSHLVLVKCTLDSEKVRPGGNCINLFRLAPKLQTTAQLTCVAGGPRRFGETPVWALYWILADERLRKSGKATKGRGAGLSSAKIQYGAQTDVSAESTRTVSYAGYSTTGLLTYS